MQNIVLLSWLSSAVLPPGTVDFPVKLIGDNSWVELVFDGQTVRFIPDTGGADTFVLYKDAFGPSKCQTFAAGCYFCPGDSCAESEKENITARFLDGGTFTYFRHRATLNLRLQNSTGVKVSDYPLGVVKEYSPKTCDPSPILALGKQPGFSRAPNSFIHQLVRGSGGAVRRLAFPITFPRTSTDIGHLTAGGNPDPDWHAPFVTLHQNDSRGWILDIDEVGYRSRSESEAIHIAKARVLFDSGSDVIFGPTTEVRKLLSFIGKLVHLKGGKGLKIIDCSDISKLPEIWFDVESDDELLTARVFIEGKDYAVPFDDAGNCTIDISGGKNPPGPSFTWVIGVPLFKGHFVQFTYGIGSIAFAKKKV
ncbi:hypothetical protein FOL47_002312 [Perkinsus chesapeaki]|uniref:Peptidase A1 domain-containing protein n=1 Tax=Perkinsus chesapeaki TaxID=330153 RepID=A0A7J6MFW1_PERCH|nr:hypothetical protein FOL47_002312 [Perkinsus chesapeaki]